MTIRRGQDWGTRGTLSPDAPIADSDRALAALFTVVDDEISGPERVGLTGGDLARTVGAHASVDELGVGERTILPIDLGVIRIGETQYVMAASLVIRGSWWTGPIHGVMNASFLGHWNVAPSGHPNDGRFDVLHTDLSLADRVKARRRLRNGTHVPHPDIGMRKLRTGKLEPEAAASIWIDGLSVTPADLVEFTVHADAVEIVI